MGWMKQEVAIGAIIRIKSRMTSQPFLVPSVLILLCSIPLVLGVVPRNRVYGFRTCKTLSDDKVWYPANRFGGWALIIACVFYLALSSLAPYDQLLQGNFSVWSIHFLGFLLPVAAGVILTLLYIRKL